jgi:hypothetical protein
MQASSSAMKKLNIAEKINAMMLDGTVGTGDKLETIVLDEKEVNAILVYGMTMDMAAKQDLDRDLKDVMFNDGAFTVMISKKIWISSPFGQYLNIKVVFVPGIQNRHFYVVPRNMNIGSLGLPESLVQGRISKELSMVEQTETGQAVLGIISELKLEKGRLTITYSPKKLVSYINENSMGAGGLLGGGLGGMNLPELE